MFHSPYRFSSRAGKSRRFVDRNPASRRVIAERLEDRCLLTGLVFDSVILANSDTVGAYSFATATDSAGNTYMGGNFAGVMDFDLNVSHAANADILTARGNTDAFVAKYGSQGQFLWARRMGGDSASISEDQVQSIAIDNTYNVYLGGKFAQSADFGAVTLNSEGITDAFVSKLDGNGNFLWANGWGTEVGEYVDDLVVDESGNVTAVGSTVMGVVGFVREIELRQFDANGNVTWIGQFASGDSAFAPSVSRGADGNLLIGGNFKGSVDLDPGPGEHWVTGSSTTNNAFVLKLSAGGGLLWAASLVADTSQDANSSVKILDMAIGDDGSIALLGSYQGQVDVDPSSGVFLLPNAQTIRTYFARLSTSGALVTATTYDGGAVFYSLATVSGGFAVALNFGSNPVFNPVPGISFTSKGSDDIAIMVVTPDGAVAWAGQVGGASADYCFDMVSDGSGGALLTGFSGASSSSDYDPDPNRTYTVNNPAWADAFVLKLKPLGDTKFYVVNDASTNRTYEYDASGNSVEDYAVNIGNSTPRGAASTAAGDNVWVVDSNKKVYVYNPSGSLLGSWTAGSLPSNANVQGVATHGTDIWLVDAQSDKIYRYTGAAVRLSGSQNAASSFSLNSGNKDATDLVTDGTSIWVVNNSSTDKVFKYTLTGTFVASWTILTSGAGSPTGITLDPSNPAHLWIVDSGTDRVYEYSNSMNQANGSSKSANTSFALAAGNTNPQGIADPPPQGTQLATRTQAVLGLGSVSSPVVSRASASVSWSVLKKVTSELSAQDDWLRGEFTESNESADLDFPTSDLQLTKKPATKRLGEIRSEGDHIVSRDITGGVDLDDLFADWSADPLQLLTNDR